MNNQDFDKLVNSFVLKIEDLQKEAYSKYEIKSKLTVTKKDGRKWIKILVKSNDLGQGATYAFIAKEDISSKVLGDVKKGDINRPANHQNPAKTAVGNIFLPNFGNCYHTMTYIKLSPFNSYIG